MYIVNILSFFMFHSHFASPAFYFFVGMLIILLNFLWSSRIEHLQGDWVQGSPMSSLTINARYVALGYHRLDLTILLFIH